MNKQTRAVIRSDEEEVHNFKNSDSFRERNNNQNLTRNSVTDKSTLKRKKEFCSDLRNAKEGIDELHNSLRLVPKGPKKLILKTKGTRGKKNDEEQRTNDNTITLVRGKAQRKFVLLQSENFNFHSNFRNNNRKDLIHYFSALEIRGPSRLPASVLMRPLVDSIGAIRLDNNVVPFERRVTAIEWHPTQPNKVAVGSKAGEIVVLDVAKEDPQDEALSLPGTGPGGSVGSMHFCPLSPEWLLVACMDSTVTLRNLEADRRSKVLHDTGNYKKWFVSCDMSSSLYAAGQSTGIIQLFDRISLKKVSDFKIHKSKISHVEFSKHHEYLLATSSVGHEVKIWDVRKMESTSKNVTPLHTLSHDAGVNTASFSRFNGQRLLTSDQYGQIRVYALPGFYLERSILHPHRQFRHLTPIKASWHPLQDLIVIGRWPDPDFVGYSANEKRTVDIFDANTGDLSLQVYDGGLGGIISLNEFSNDGQVLCSGMSRNVLLWRQPKTWDGDSPEARDAGILYGKNLIGGGKGNLAKTISRRGKTKEKSAEGKKKKKVSETNRNSKEKKDDDRKKYKLNVTKFEHE